MIDRIALTRRTAILFTLLLGACWALPLPALAASVIGSGAAVTVGTTATALDDPSIDDARYGRSLLACVPEDAAGPIYVGSAAVTVAGGIPVPPGACYSVQLAAKARVYAVAETPTEVRVQEAY